MATSADIATAVRVRAIAWLARHHEVTLGQGLAYLMTIRHTHWPMVVEAWREHGLSTALVDALAAKFAPKAQEASP